MPIYEYRCGACGHTLEALQKLSEDPLKQCPECREEALRRLISAPAFRLKGGGWYETDFKSDKEKKRNLADKPESNGKAAEKSTSDAAKPSASTESTPKSKESTPKESAKSSVLQQRE